MVAAAAVVGLLGTIVVAVVGQWSRGLVGIVAVGFHRLIVHCFQNCFDTARMAAETVVVVVVEAVSAAAETAEAVEYIRLEQTGIVGQQGFHIVVVRQQQLLGFQLHCECPTAECTGTGPPTEYTAADCRHRTQIAVETGIQ